MEVREAQLLALTAWMVLPGNLFELLVPPPKLETMVLMALMAL
jgi:hypothetical protein